MGKTNWIRTFAVVVMILGAIGAFAAGTSRYGQNWSITLYGLIGIVLFSAFFLALASILDAVRDSAYSLRAMLPKKPESTKSEDPQPAKTEENGIDPGLYPIL